MLATRTLIVGEQASLIGVIESDEFDTSDLLSLDKLLALGKELFDGWSKAAWELVCGSKAGESKEQLANALGAGKSSSAAAAIAGVLVAHGAGLSIAVPVAWIAVKLFLEPGYEATCAVWHSHLPA